MHAPLPGLRRSLSERHLDRKRRSDERRLTDRQADPGTEHNTGTLRPRADRHFRTEDGYVRRLRDVAFLESTLARAWRDRAVPHLLRIGRCGARPREECPHVADGRKRPRVGRPRSERGLHRERRRDRRRLGRVPAISMARGFAAPLFGRTRPKHHRFNKGRRVVDRCRSDRTSVLAHLVHHLSRAAAMRGLIKAPFTRIDAPACRRRE